MTTEEALKEIEEKLIRERSWFQGESHGFSRTFADGTCSGLTKALQEIWRIQEIIQQNREATL